METTEYFIYLLSCHLNATAPKGEKRMDWQQIYNLSEKHGVTAIIAYEIKQLRSEFRPGGTIGAWFNESFENTIHSHRARLQSLALLISALSEKGIMHELFKGVVLRNYYPFPELRIGADADILIKPADYLAAVEALQEKGFSEKLIESNHAVFLNEKDIFELHTEFESINIQSKIYFATPFDDISNASGYTYKLKPVYHLLYLVSHIAHHLQAGGASIRMIMDLDVIIRKYPEININEFLMLSNNIKIGKTAETLLAFSRKIFNTPVVLHFTFEDEDTRPLFEDYISTFVSGKVFGKPDTELQENGKKNAAGIILNLFRRITKPKEDKGLSEYQLQLMEELGIDSESI